MTLIALSACKTGDESKLAGDESLPAAAAPAQGGGTATGVVMKINGAHAAAMFAKTNLQQDQSGAKRHKGRLVFHCSQDGGLPPGAQGFPGPLTYKCAANVPLPPGAQGFPAPAFMMIDGQAAQAAYGAFQAQAKWTGDWYEKVFESETAEYVCTHSECSVGKAGEVGGGGGGGGGGGNTTTTIMTLSGTTARDVYKKATLQANEQGTKKHSGNLAVYCTQKGGLPPGAQGFPGVIKYECFARVPLPPGAQGFPAPPFLKIDGTAAAGMWQAFQAQAKWLAQGGYYEKTFESTNGTFSCTKSGSTHACTVTSGTGGGNGGGGGGDFQLDLTGPAASSVYTAMNREPSANGEKRHSGRTSVFCAQKGNLPPGAQGFPGQITYRCSVTQPLPVGAVGFPAPAFLNLDGEAAFAFWEAFKPAAKWNGNSSQYEKSLRIESSVFSCAPTGNGHRCTFK